MSGTNHILCLLPFTSYNPCWPVSICSHLALYVSEKNSFFSDIQVHLLAPQLVVLRQEGETCLGLLHTLHIPVLEWERQQVLQNKEREREVKTVEKWGEMHLKIKLRRRAEKTYIYEKSRDVCHSLATLSATLEWEKVEVRAVFYKYTAGERRSEDILGGAVKELDPLRCRHFLLVPLKSFFKRTRRSKHPLKKTLKSNQSNFIFHCLSWRQPLLQ